MTTSKWVFRAEDCDFRKVKWGMSQDEVREAEPTIPHLVLPAAMMFNATFQDLPLLLVYQFAENEGHVFCVGVSLQLDRTVHQGYMKRKPVVREESNADLSSILKQLHELRRDMVNEENEEKREQLNKQIDLLGKQSETEAYSSIEKQIHARLNSGTLDQVAVNTTYEKLKKLIVDEYGEPDLSDGPLIDGPEYIEALAAQGDPDNPDDFSDCKTSYWQTESTNITLGIGPEPYRDRSISASFASLKHGRFIPGHPDYEPTQ